MRVESSSNWIKNNKRSAAVYGLIAIASIYSYVVEPAISRINNLPIVNQIKDGELSWDNYPTPLGYRIKVSQTRRLKPVFCGDGLPLGYTQTLSKEVIFALEGSRLEIITPEPVSFAVPPAAACRRR